MDFAQFDQRPVIVAIAGPNGAGKTTFYNVHLQPAALRFINVDVLARELDLENESEDVEVQNLIPEGLREGSAESFLGRLEELDPIYAQVKEGQEEGHVLRYVGELSGDLSQTKGDLAVRLVSVPEKSSLGQVQASDSIFEIYTESYGERPLVIQGAGAGAQVTARGVFGDILRLTEKAV